MSVSANIVRQWFHGVTLSITIALLTACGGSGDNNQDPGANEPPVANVDNFTVAEGAVISDNVIDNPTGQDTDPENQPLSAELRTDPAYGSLVFNADGTFTYTHDGSETTSDSFTYRAYDGENYSATATVNLTITPVNDDPVAGDDTDATNADVVLNIPASSVLLNDSDPDSINLSVTSVGPASAQGADVTVNAGDIRYDPTGVGAFIALAAGETLPVPDTFSYTVSDGNGGTDTATVSVTVTGVNDAPAAADDSGATNADTPLTILASSVLSNDTDPDTNDSLSISAADVVSAQGAVVTLNAGNIRYDPTTGTGLADFIALAAGETVSDTFSYTVSDGNGGSATATVSVTVTGVNDPPLTTGACYTTQQESILSGKKLGASDPDNGDMLTYSIISNGTKGNAVITDSTTGAYTYETNIPFNNGEWGSDSFTYRVTDLAGDYVDAQETVIIDPRIMPLGDSITRGAHGGGLPADADKIGYRKPLYDGLVAAGYSFDFVGTVTTDGTNPIYAPFDVDSEGHGGWWAKHIADGNPLYPTEGNITDWLNATSPDIILLHIGTNGLPNLTAYDNAADVGTILDRIDAWEIANGDPITVILARIIDQDPINPDVAAFNTELDAMVAGRTGDDIIVVDMENTLTTGDYVDGVHPTNAGYAKMAPVWQTALTAQVNNLLYNNKCP
jgi:VCBS repeat-containing protein